MRREGSPVLPESAKPGLPLVVPERLPVPDPIINPLLPQQPKPDPLPSPTEPERTPVPAIPLPQEPVPASVNS